MNTPEEIARLIEVMQPTCAICHDFILTPEEFTFFSRVKEGRLVQERFFHAVCSNVVFKTHLEPGPKAFVRGADIDEDE